MGVKGLTTYLKENRHKLSYTLELNSKDSIAKDEETHFIHVVVDGWSLLYAVYNNSREPWVYGGEYAALAKHVEDIVFAWKRVGIRPTFVFDGPSPPLKYPTLVTRIQDNCVKRANIFFRTSPSARSTPRSLSETRIAPPLGYAAIVSTLLSMGDDVKVEFAEGEADPHIVALAGRLGAYVVSNDSDFIISSREGYKGFMPLDEMVWCASIGDTRGPSPDSLSPVGDGDSGFQVATKKKEKGRLRLKESGLELGLGPIPPSFQGQAQLSLVLTVYEPASLANHVSLPLSLLPLLGAFIGNDYALPALFRLTESSTSRVQRAADTLSSVLKEAQSGTSKKIRRINRGEQGSVMDVIGTTVERLLLWRNPRDPPASGQIDQITETIIQSTLEYAMESPASLFLYDERSVNQGIGSHTGSLGYAAKQVRNLYLRAYHRGILHPRLMETFARGVCFPTHFLEDPDRECCVRTIGRPVREVIWKVFVTGGGIPNRLDPMPESVQQFDEHAVEDEDELVDVVEENTDDDELSVEDEEDPLAALRGRLQRLSFSGSEAPETPEVPELTDLLRPNTMSCTPTSYSDIPQPTLQPKVVTEYVRRGTRVALEDTRLDQLDDCLWDATENPTPLQLRPMPERLSVFLKILGSDTPHVRAIATEACQNESVELSGGKLLLVVTLRWVLQTLHNRAEGLEDGNRKRDREKEKWTRSEAEAFLSSLSEGNDQPELPSINNRAIQLNAQLLSALEAVGWLAQSLLLVDMPISHNDSEKDEHLPVVFGEAEKNFSGQKFHSALARGRKGSPGKLFQQLWDASTEGLDNVFGDEKGRRRKKARKAEQRKNPQVASLEKNVAGGMFAALTEFAI